MALGIYWLLAIKMNRIKVTFLLFIIFSCRSPENKKIIANTQLIDETDVNVIDNKDKHIDSSKLGINFIPKRNYNLIKNELKTGKVYFKSLLIDTIRWFLKEFE